MSQSKKIFTLSDFATNKSTNNSINANVKNSNIPTSTIISKPVEQNSSESKKSTAKQPKTSNSTTLNSIANNTIGNNSAASNSAGNNSAGNNSTGNATGNNSGASNSTGNNSGGSNTPMFNGIMKAGEIIVDMAKKVDLHSLHNQVLHYFDEKEGRMQRLKRREKVLKSEETDSFEDQIKVQDELQTIDIECSKLANKLTGRTKYENDSKVLLDQHNDILPKGKQRVIGNTEDNLSPDEYEELKIIIEEFVDLAQNFIKINVKKDTYTTLLCNNCDTEPIMIDGKLRCPSCNKKVKAYEQKSASESLNRDVSCLHTDYYRSETFEDTIAAFQGKQKWIVPNEVWEVIDKYCDKYRLDKRKLSKEDIYTILRKNGFSENYNDINLIAYKISDGKIPLPDISKLEERLLLRHRLIEEEFEAIKEADEKNFMRGQYVLWMLLSMEKYRCNISDFKMLETRDVILRHDNKMKIITERLKLRRPDLNWSFKGLA